MPKAGSNKNDGLFKKAIILGEPFRYMSFSGCGYPQVYPDAEEITGSFHFGIYGLC